MKLFIDGGMEMKKRKLGTLEVSAIGMGCMGFTHAYGAAPAESDGIKLVHKAFELGCNFFDTAEMYSYFKNEEFVGKALKDLPRDKVVISDKFWSEKLPGHNFAEEKFSEAVVCKRIMLTFTLSIKQKKVRKNKLLLSWAN